MDIQQLIYFSKIAELQNISKAADALYISQPTLSRMVKKLEEELQCRLFLHKGKNIYLTENGRIFHQRAQEMLRILSRTKNELSSKGSGKEDITIHLRCMSGLFFEVLNEFISGNADGCFHILQSDNQGIALADFDYLFIPTETPTFSASCRTILKEEIFIALSTHHPLATKPVLLPEDIMEQQYVSIAKNRYLYKLTSAQREQMGCASPCQLFCDDMVAVRNLVRDGAFISHIPQFTWCKEDLDGIVLKPVEGFPLYRYISVSWNSDVYMGQIARKFYTYILHLLKQRKLLFEP